ncbi:MAG: hypothetical protein JRI53_01505 [Deltaproteobacteria bacterium]|nr:hypothetical protein [Deltaproteobacteria bacterium]MBW2178769.1 hypothetical protein [Deltaproteobacteria bacterium]MBW2363480.1 hypothetical protein [Deltaproteobacteria bacterium]
MANEVTENNLTIEIAGVGAGAIDSDWSYADDPNDRGLKIMSIQFSPAATGDKCVIKEGDEDGPEIFNPLCADVYDSKIKYFHGKKKHPFLDFGDGVYTAGAKVVIELAERR